MKKLKIFLLLGILLCFGFALSSEVHASDPKILQENTYLTFQSTSSFTLKVNDNTKHWDGTLYYSTDTTTWNVWDGTTTLSSVGNKLYLRGTGNTIIAGDPDYRWVLAGSNIECIGNIENLLDYETVALGNHPAMANYCYNSMFYGCTGLITAPSLPATTLTDFCYGNMYYDCTGLTIPPSLPAITLALGCYFSMFKGCTALKVSTTQIGAYQYAWRIPTSGTGTTAPSWNTSMLSNTGGTFTGNPTINTTYYVEIPPVSGFNITFEENGGTEQTDLTEQTALPDPLPIPTKEGYTFVGWYYDSDFFNEALAGDSLTDDVILYARWLPGKLFQVDDVLPATTQLKIRILFGQGDYHVETVDRSGIYLSIEWIDGDLDLYVEFDGLVQYDGEVTAGEIYYTIDISNWSLDQRTIKSVSSENGNFVTWEDANPDGYTQGYLTAREEYGYYDSRTNEWLSVEEYLELYGTDKLGQSDFYNNFDKYFIPAMIIVFGGAIVLTILKVFKGRE